MESPVVLAIIAINCLVSYKGFQDQVFFDKYKFSTFYIGQGKDYKRMITSGFLHANWMHLLFNMYAFYSFAQKLELELGAIWLLAIYFSSLIGGNLLSYYINRKNSAYSAIGASGAVSGIIFACIALYPGEGVGFILLPFGIPGWVFALLYIAYSVYGIKTKRDNIGHEAHLGGAILGAIVAISYRPEVIYENTFNIAIICIPTFIFLLIIIFKPEWVIQKSWIQPIKPTKRPSPSRVVSDEEFNQRKAEANRKMNRILDKVSKSGVDSLTSEEKEWLDRNSR